MARPHTTPEQERKLALVGAELRRHREAAGYSQVEFARMTTGDDKYVSRVERGLVNISVTRAIEFADALGITPGAILDAASSAHRE